MHTHLTYCTNTLVNNIKVVHRLGALRVQPQHTALLSVFCTPNPLVYVENCSMKLPQPQFPIV